MPRRQILTERSRAALFDLPTDEPSLLRHYTLADDDIEHIRARRLAHNQLGFGLNKGEAHHALKNALRIGRQGEIRDRTAEAQHYRMAGLNLLAAIIIYWNTDQLGKAVQQRKKAGLDCAPELLSHISPLGWAHILLTGEYRWPKS